MAPVIWYFKHPPFARCIRTTIRMSIVVTVTFRCYWLRSIPVTEKNKSSPWGAIMRATFLFFAFSIPLGVRVLQCDKGPHALITGCLKTANASWCWLGFMLRLCVRTSQVVRISQVRAGKNRAQFLGIIVAELLPVNMRIIARTTKKGTKPKETIPPDMVHSLVVFCGWKSFGKLILHTDQWFARTATLRMPCCRTWSERFKKLLRIRNVCWFKIQSFQGLGFVGPRV